MKRPELVTVHRAATELDLTVHGVLLEIQGGALRARRVQSHGPMEDRFRVAETELDRYCRLRWVGDPRELRRANVARARARVRAFKREVHAATLAAKRDVRRRDAAWRAEALAEARQQAVRLGSSVSESRPRRQTLPRGATQDDLLLARKNLLESAVRRSGARARSPAFHTLCSVPLADGTFVRWRYWPALGKREYLEFDGAAT